MKATLMGNGVAAEVVKVWVDDPALQMVKLQLPVPPTSNQVSPTVCKVFSACLIDFTVGSCGISVGIWASGPLAGRTAMLGKCLVSGPAALAAKASTPKPSKTNARAQVAALFGTAFFVSVFFIKTFVWFSLALQYISRSNAKTIWFNPLFAVTALARPRSIHKMCANEKLEQNPQSCVFLLRSNVGICRQPFH